MAEKGKFETAENTGISCLQQIWSCQFNYWRGCFSSNVSKRGNSSSLRKVCGLTSYPDTELVCL